MNGVQTLEEGIAIIRKRLLEAQKEIKEELVLQMNESILAEDVPNIQSTQGKKFKNDYREYYWIKVRTKLSHYWITLFHNDVDENSGNFHTQIGRIQFWKDISYKESRIGTPNRRDSSGQWQFCRGNSYDSGFRIDEAEYSAKKVVEKFLEFLEKNGESNVRKQS